MNVCLNEYGSSPHVTTWKYILQQRHDHALQETNAVGSRCKCLRVFWHVRLCKMNGRTSPVTMLPSPSVAHLINANFLTNPFTLSQLTHVLPNYLITYANHSHNKNFGPIRLIWPTKRSLWSWHNFCTALHSTWSPAVMQFILTYCYCYWINFDLPLVAS